MNFQKPLEGLLRPPIEWLTCITIFLIILLWLSFLKYFLLIPILIIFGCYRFYQGYRIVRYQKNLKTMPHYSMKRNELPVSNRTLFLGKGFLWTSQHTQRIRDLDLPYNLHYKNSKTDLGGDAAIHGIADQEEDIAIHLNERASHLLVLGLPGVGKTRFAELVISQDIRRDDVVIVLDPKGDAGLLRRIYQEAKIAGR